MKKILVVKNGGLGDVVRTSYFAKPLKNKGSNIGLYWLTSPEAVDILQFNPYIDSDKKVRCGWLYMYVDIAKTALVRNLKL